MTQAEIEAELENLNKQLSQLVERQQSRNKRRLWIGGFSMLLAIVYLFAAAVITPLHTLGPAGIPLLFVGLALYGCEMERP